MAAIVILFVLLLYVFFVSNNLESTFDNSIANNSAVEQEGFEVPTYSTRGSERGRGRGSGKGKGKGRGRDEEEEEEDSGYKNDRGGKGGGGEVNKVVDTVQSLVDQLDDDLRINKYRKEYDKVVTTAEELFELCRLSQLTKLKDTSSKDLDKVASIAKVLNDLGGGIDSLDGIKTYIDGK